MAENDMMELPGLRVNIDDVVYQPQFSMLADQPHCFVYYITIHNESETIVTIKGRKWVVKESSGEVTAVEGDGVVGEFPRLGPGQKFNYNSSHVFSSQKAVATGSYLGVDDFGNKIITRIPEFVMVVPDLEIG